MKLCGVNWVSTIALLITVLLPLVSLGLNSPEWFLSDLVPDTGVVSLVGLIGNHPQFGEPTGLGSTLPSFGESVLCDQPALCSLLRGSCCL